jgi:flagellar biosynthetic protein FlhB
MKSMSDDSDLEKSHPASPRRLEKAREEGQIPRSRDLASLVMLAAGFAGLWALASNMGQQLVKVFNASLGFDAEGARSSSFMLERVGEVLVQGLLLLLPMLGLMMLAAFVAPLFLGGWLFSTEALAPKLSRLNPVQGIGRLFSSQSLAELGKTIAKSLLIGSVATTVLWNALPQLLDLLREPAAVAMPAALAVVGWTCVLVSASLLLVALIDVPWQLWSHHKKLRMTLEEVKKEHKETEGDPYIKAQMRRQRQQMARRRMMAEVPKADVVLTNPTHYAVALRYEEGGTGAPRVVAKGMDLVAERIKALAAEHRIPLLEAPPLARALHKHTALGEEIPGALYTAVAEVLTWAMQLKRATHGERPPTPVDLPVPSDMDPLHTASGTRT